jgi:protein-disulfide isomerase
MNRQRIFVLLALALVFTAVSALYMANTWRDMTTRFRTGLPVPRSILPRELLDATEFVPAGPATLPPIRSTDPVLHGSASSTIVVAVFGDFQCEFCRTQARAIEDALIALGKDASRVGVVWRDYPIVSEHPKAEGAAVAAQCAARQGRFRQMHDLLFFQAKDLSDAEFLTFADQLRLNKDQFLTCMRDPAIRFRIENDLIEARSVHGITSVPLLFINGKLIDGLTDADLLAAIIRRELSIVQP